MFSLRDWEGKQEGEAAARAVLPVKRLILRYWVCPLRKPFSAQVQRGHERQASAALPYRLAWELLRLPQEAWELQGRAVQAEYPALVQELHCRRGLVVREEHYPRALAARGAFPPREVAWELRAS